MDTTNLVRFHGHAMKVIDHAGRRWFTAEEIGLALGYDPSNARKGILKLYERHADEFTEADTCVVTLTMQGQARAIRLFSETGCNKLGFFANTVIAKEFRHFAALVLAGQAVPTATVSSRGVRRGRLLVTRKLEREVLEMFVAGAGQSGIAESLRISGTTVNHILHGKYRFSPDAGPDECTPELLAAVADRFLEDGKWELTQLRQRIAQRFCAHAANQRLVAALDDVGTRLLALTDTEGGAQ